MEMMLTPDMRRQEIVNLMDKAPVGSWVTWDDPFGHLYKPYKKFEDGRWAIVRWEDESSIGSKSSARDCSFWIYETGIHRAPNIRITAGVSSVALLLEVT